MYCTKHRSLVLSPVSTAKRHHKAEIQLIRWEEGMRGFEMKESEKLKEKREKNWVSIWMGTPASVRHHKPFFFIWCVCVLVCVLFQGFLEKKIFSSSCTRKLHLAGWSTDAVKSPARGSWGIPQFFRAFEVTVVYYSAELQHTCRRTHACVGTWSYVWMCERHLGEALYGRICVFWIPNELFL